MDKLKRCPFCGGEAKVHKMKVNFMYEEWAYSIYCYECQAQVRYTNTLNKAIEEWNKRIKEKENNESNE